MADREQLTSQPDPSSTPDTEIGDVAGENLADHLAEPEPYEITADEDEAEELQDEALDAGTLEADVDEDPVDDPVQLSEAEQMAAAARDTRPVRKARPAAVAPVKKERQTPRQRRTAVKDVAKRATPAQFVRESAGELRKVVWPTASQLRQYFIVVLVFVLIIIAYVSLLDLGFGALLLKIFG